MRMLTLFRYAVGISGVAILGAGCSSGGPSPGPAFALAPGEINPTSQSAPGYFHPYRRWVAPDIARRPRLLFVSDQGTRSVNIYLMPSLRRVGQVAGFRLPYGECADAGGNIWVVDFIAKEITKLSRTGDILRVLDDRDGVPWSCAVDPTTGNLAVANYEGTTGAGNVVIYAHAAGRGTPITNPQVYLYYFVGYNTSGNLWVDGQDASGEFILSSCSKTSCSTIPISGGEIYYPGFLQYAVGQRTWYVADRECVDILTFCMYPVSARGALGKRINLKDPQGKTVCSMFEGAITNASSRVIVGGVRNGVCLGVNSVARWSFPDGGDSTHGTSDVSNPTGAAISMK